MTAALLFTLVAALMRALAMPGVLPWLQDWAWCAAFVAVVLRLRGWHHGARGGLDYLGGLVFWLLSFAFLVHVHPLAPWGAAIILGSCWWVEGWLYRLLSRRFQVDTAALMALPTAEYLRMTWFYLGVGGVPWASWGLALASSPFFAWARYFGESGLVLLAVSGGCALYALCFSPRRWASALVFGLLLAAVLLPVESPPAQAETLRCLAVQPNVSLEEKHGPWSANSLFDRQNMLTREALERGEKPALILWAETMWPYPAAEEDAEGTLRRLWPQAPDEVEPMAKVVFRQQVMVRTVLAAAPAQAYFLTGAHFYYPVAAEGVGGAPPDYSPRKSEIVLFDADGRLVQHFSKQQLVPFGEALPFGGHFPGAEWLREYAHRNFGLRPDFARSAHGGPLRSAPGLPELGAAVCWENVFAAPFRAQAEGGARAFVVLSNEDWFGQDGMEMQQMVAATRLRAAETGLAMLRVTNTGHTCLVLADGRVDGGLAPGVEGSWGVDLPLRSPQQTDTWYLRGGWRLLPLWACWSGFLVFLAVFFPTRKLLQKARNLSTLDPSSGVG